MSQIELLDSSSSVSNNKNTSYGRVILGITGGLAVGITLVCASFVSPALRKYCLPYVPASENQIKNVLLALKGRRGTLLDLGSGDGRIVLETSKKHFVSDGVELNIWLVLYSRLSALRMRVRAKFYRRNLWNFDISKYDNVVIFGVEQMMNDLEKKLIKECKPTCRIIACRFPLPFTKPTFTVGNGIDKVWIYDIKDL